MADLVSLGEMMLCLSAPKYQRLTQATSLNMRACGAQLNVAANLAGLGKQSVFITALPSNDLGMLAMRMGRALGVDMTQVKFMDGARMGLIFIEYGVGPRHHIHIYDRENSAASQITPADFDWNEILSRTRLAYLDGIFPALNQGCRAAAFAFAEAAKGAGCTLCFDVNYRASLWEPEAAVTFYRSILPKIDILVTNRAFSERLLGYCGGDLEILRSYRQDFGCQVVCMTYRSVPQKGRGAWRSLALVQDNILQGREFEYEEVDRFGTGDAFFAGFLHGYLEKGVQYGLDFGNAMCALAHTVDGDQAIFSPKEVDTLLSAGYSYIMRR